MAMLISSQARQKYFYHKPEIQMFVLISSRHIGVPCWYTSTIQSSIKLRETFW